MTSNNTFDAKVFTAAARFLEQRGYEILDEPTGLEAVNLVALDEGTLALVSVRGKVADDAGYGKGPKRKSFELDAMKWLAENRDYVNTTVRFDRLSVMVLPPDRALIRHEIGAFGSPEA